ncbi:serine--tRNA ligase [Paenibacillus allorhizosphaerae]|uniref:Serine--tRNA ligase n=1 Tax=Paenibacillus allorhizosphaerae TaxID=2849866 RepID=A0ABN7TNZ9_9BACL|nr:serine--tRNA ligase [Paenibacillus allorhizosphaerae]CAG7644300.1 Serine--tRNA ligase [Paenibacillus allorhizosphaerae]
MLDIKFIRQHREMLQTVADGKGITLSIDELLRWDERRRKLLQEAEALRQERNVHSRDIGRLIGEGNREAAEQVRQDVQETIRRLSQVEAELAEAERQFTLLAMRVPNPVSPDTPAGRSDQDNVEVKRFGEPPVFDFAAKDHVALGELHDLIDIPRGVKTAGTRNYYLKGAGALLHRAVQQLALDLLIGKGFTLLEVPLLVRTEALTHTGFFPFGEEQTFRIAEENKWLVGTSEVPLVSYHADEVIELSEPRKYAAVSQCFRNEIGSAGRDVHGLYRVHQFAKVEQVILCEASLEQSDRMLHEITGHAEELLQLLELPYRVMSVCIGDMSQKTYKQFDIETWMPSRQAYGETHSSSALLDFQARRSNIRYRDAEGKLTYCHTLNNTAVASPRILIPLLETHQEEDGSIRIPHALRPYINGLERLVAQQ